MMLAGRSAAACLLLAACGVLACHRAYTGEYAEAKETTDGIYDFRAVVEGAPVKGAFAIRGDFFTLDLDNGSCPLVNDRRDMQARSQRVVGVSCKAMSHDIVFSVSLDNPLRGSTWRSSRTEVRHRQICRRSTTTKDGKEVCVEYAPEPYEVVVSIGGQLNVQLNQPR